MPRIKYVPLFVPSHVKDLVRILSTILRCPMSHVVEEVIKLEAIRNDIDPDQVLSDISVETEDTEFIAA